MHQWGIFSVQQIQIEIVQVFVTDAHGEKSSIIYIFNVHDEKTNHANWYITFEQTPFPACLVSIQLYASNSNLIPTIMLLLLRGLGTTCNFKEQKSLAFSRYHLSRFGVKPLFNAWTNVYAQHANDKYTLMMLGIGSNIRYQLISVDISWYQYLPKTSQMY